MTVYEFELNTVSLGAFTAQETQMICMSASEIILTHFQNLLLQGKELEQLQLASFKSFIRRYVGSLEGVFDFAKIPNFQLKIIAFRMKIDESHLTDLIGMNTDGFRSIGSTLVNKLLAKILNSTLDCLQDSVAPFSSHNELMIDQCREKGKLIEKQINKIITRENWIDGFLVNSHTVLNSVVLKIEIVYATDTQSQDKSV